MNNSFLECAGSESILHKLYPEGPLNLKSEDDRYGYNVANALFPLLVYIRDYHNIPLDINKLISSLSYQSLNIFVELKGLPEDLKFGLCTYVDLLDADTKPIHNRGVYNLYFRSIRFLRNLSDVSISMVQPESRPIVRPSVESVLSKATSIFVSNGLLDNTGILTRNANPIDYEHHTFFEQALSASIEYRNDSRKYSLNIVRVFMRTALQSAAKEAHRVFMGFTPNPATDTGVATSAQHLQWQVLDQGLILMEPQPESLKLTGQTTVCSTCGFESKDDIGNDDCCVLCHESLYATSSKGYMLWLPELTQSEVNWLSRWLSSLAIYRQTSVASHLREALTAWMSFLDYRRTIVNDLFGSSNANVLYQAGWRDQLAIQGMRYFTFVGDNIDDWDYPIRFSSAVESWKENLSSMVSESKQVSTFLNSIT